MKKNKSIKTLRMAGLLLCLFAVFCIAPWVDAASELTFDNSGKPTGMVFGDVDMLGTSSNYRFVIKNGDTDVGIQSCVTSGDQVVVTATGGSPVFTVRIDTYDNYLSIHLVDVSGVSEDSDWNFQLNLNATGTVGIKTFDDVIGIGHNGAVTLVYIKWPYPWKQRDNGSHGSVALYNGTLEGAELDAVLAEIWSTESAADMPRPAGQSSWTASDVLSWVDTFDEQFSDLSEVMLEADTEEELYTLTDQFLLLNPVKRVYLHTRTWRGEYWPTYYGIDNVNTNVFPAGRDDLKAYADYLHAHGIMLKLHNVSCGIGLYDPDYVVGTVDRRLASWGSGTLEAGISSSATTFTFIPDSGTEWPPKLHPNNLDRSKFFRIGEEIIHVGDFTNTTTGVWTLSGCTRGYGGTDSSSHSNGVEVVGLECPYDRNYVPADDLAEPDSLMDEMALKMANLINYVGADHIHFDGIEIHDISPWCGRNMTSQVYQYVDHQVTSSAVGKIIDANFEYEFSGLRDDPTLGYFPLNVDLRMERQEDDGYRNLATSALHAHFHVQDLLMIGGRRVELGRAESGRGITRELLETCGLTGEILQLWQYWLQLAPVFHDDDLAYVAQYTTKTPGSNHYQSEYVLALSVNSDNKYVFTPVHVMGQEGDDPWKIDQEWGAIPRKQIISVGDTLALSNPLSAQSLSFIIRNMYVTSAVLTDPVIEISGSGSVQVSGSLNSGEYLEYTGGNTATVYDKNWNFLRNLSVQVQSSFTVPSGDVSVTVGGSGSPSLEVQFIVSGVPYVLKANDALTDLPPGPVELGFPPVADDLSEEVAKNGAVAITLSGSDINDAILGYTLVTEPEHGTLSGDAPDLTYTPDPDYIGTDFFTFIVNNDVTNSLEGTVSITVYPSGPPVARWAMDDGNGSVVSDVSGNGFNGTLTGGTWVNGYNGGAIDFNGSVSSDSVNIPANAFSTVSNQISVAMWVKGDAALQPRNDSLFYAADASGNRVLNIHLPYSDSKVYWDAGDSVGYDRLNKAAASESFEGRWNHWVFTKNVDTGTMKIYLNGALWLSGTGKTSPIGTVANVRLGSGLNNSYYEGALDDVRIYDYALSDAAVSTLFSSYDSAPIAYDVSVVVVGNGSVAVVLNGMDPEGGNLTYNVASQPAYGDLSGADTNLTYTPNAGYTGPDSFTYTVSDGVSTSAAATVWISVEDALVADDQSVKVKINKSVSITLGGSHAYGKSFGYTVVSDPSSGTLSGTEPYLTYTPNVDFNGSDHFTFVVTDGENVSAPATVSIAVVDASQWIAWNDAVTISSTGDVSTNGTSVWAYSFGAAGSNVINGVTFTGESSPTGNVNVITDLSLISIAYGNGSGTFSTLSSAYQDVLKSGAYRGGLNSTITLNGLNIGSEYEVQLWMNDSRNRADMDSIPRMATIAGTSFVVDYNTAGSNTNDGVGQSMIGTFTADASTQSIELLSAAPQLNAIQLRELYTSKTSPDVYSVWVAGYGLSGINSLPAADSENEGKGDGYNNVAEFALGMNPAVSDAGSRESCGVVGAGETNWFEYVHYRRADYLDRNLSYLLVDSTNLLNATTHTNAQDRILIGDAVGEYESVTNRYRTEESVRFIQLKILHD
jgi:hypothetical protein